MHKIALITDSSCNLSLSYLDKYNIKLLPLRIIYNDKEFLDYLEISPEQLLSNIDTEIPSTSLPDLNYASQVIEKLIEEGYTKCIVTTLSSVISGTFNSLRLLSENYADDMDFYFLDSKTLGFVHGAINIKIAELIQDNYSFEDITSRLEDIRLKSHGFLTCSTLEYLRKGGRIGLVSGTIGEMLNIKPIISSNEEGLLYTLAKARGRKQSISKLRDCALEYLDKGPCRVWVLNSNVDEEADKLLNSLKDHPNVLEISIIPLGAAVLVHTGPGSLGLCILED